MDKLRNTTHTAVAAVKEKIPFLGDTSEPETDQPDTLSDRYVWSEKAKRFRDMENGRFVSRETALGRTAVAQVVAPPTPRQLNKTPVKTSRSKNKSGNTSATNRNSTTVVFGPRIKEIDLDGLWNGSGSREAMAEKVMGADPILYLRYVAARERFITSEASARGAGVVDSAQKTSLLGRLRRKLPERFRNNGQPVQDHPEDFASVYDEALKVALASYGNLSPEEQYERRLELESDAGYMLEWDVSKKKIEASGDKKFSLSRKAAIFGGLLVAGGVGAATGVWERMQKGEHDVRFLGLAAFLGAAAGFGAAKAYQPTEDESTAAARAQEAREAVRLAYDRNSPADLEQRSTGIESIKDATKRDKRRALGRTALGIGGGALVGAGGHLLIDMWPMLSHYRSANIHDSPPPSDVSTDPTLGADVGGETYSPLDTNHDGIVNAQDMPDINHDGVVDYQDQTEIYDPLDTNHDGVVNGQDMPDNNGDGLITADDNYDPLDTNHDGMVDEHDMPDTNRDDVVDHQDQAKVYDPLDTNHDGVVDTQDVPDANNDGRIDTQDLPQDTESDAAPVQQEPIEKPAQDIYIEPGSSVTNEFHQYSYNTYGVDLSDTQLDSMYNDLIDSGHYTPEQLFNEVDFYAMEDGRWGMQDIGSAELTGTGQTAIGDWLLTNGLGQ